jgi:retron-type reverse transcriptase
MFDRIISKENLYQAAHRAALGKRFRENIARCRYYLEAGIDRLHEDLKSGAYLPGRYKVFRIFDPKERDISVAPFRDRIVHHAFHGVIEPAADARFIFDSYACRRGKGTRRAVERAQGFLRANRFCLHGDIRKYFPSIDHVILKRLLVRYVECARTRFVLERIIDSANQIVLKPGQGLPIGNLTSQFFANLYLHELDRFVKHDMKRKYYVRYMDDFLVFDQSRECLEEVKGRARDFLRDDLGLDLHEGKSRIFSRGQGVTFLGFRIFADRRRLAGANVRRLREMIKAWRRSERLGRGFPAVSLRGWFAHARRADSVMVRRAVLREWLKGPG